MYILKKSSKKIDLEGNKMAVKGTTYMYIYIYICVYIYMYMCEYVYE
jgi:hypothetical protein